MSQSAHPVALIILDGWGWSQAKTHNPFNQVPTPHFDHLFSHCPHRLIDASGHAVGLPLGQIGNSEVGHLHLGAGRLMLQDLTRINDAIEKGEFEQNPILQQALKQVKERGASIHILGLLSPGGVHSHEDQLAALVRVIAKQEIHHCYLHAFLDGRDVIPQSAESSLQKLDRLFNELHCGHIASLVGRYYAMDRDKRWDRIQKAYELLVEAKADYQANDVLTALSSAYQRGETDEFVKPTLIGPKAQPIQNGDIVIFMNFRADRARQLCHALVDSEFNEFKRAKRVEISTLLTLTEYDDQLNAQAIFPSIPIHNTFGEYLSKLGLKQLRLAETEKYAHVTYFFNGGIETPFDGEDRCLIPSPKVATYDLQPEMSAPELTDKLVNAILSKQYDAIICNYANFDMIGHTGNPIAALKTIEVIDACLGRVLDALSQTNMEALITADHGNIECIYDELNSQPHTAHTTNLVPLVYVGKRAAEFRPEEGGLKDIAPSLINLMGLRQPPEMNGHNLIHLK